MKRFKWDKKYLYAGVTAFMVIAACILFYILITRLPLIFGTLKWLTGIISPFIIGLVIAYLLSPLLRKLETSLLIPLFNKIIKPSRRKAGTVAKLSRGISVFVCIVLLLAIIFAVFWLIVPQLYSSIESLVSNWDTYWNEFSSWLDNILVNYPEIENALNEGNGTLSEMFLNWLKNNVLPGLSNIIANVTNGIYVFVRVVLNFIIGVIVSAYVMFNKEKFSAYAKKVLYCIFSVEASSKILSAVRTADKVFIGFIVGKIADSAIIGVICYLFCVIANMPYAMLVSVAIGITNIIPYFGPFIGGVPSALLIFVMNPLQGLIFAIFVIVLQQFDGNFLGPKILGSTIGINGFWVMFAIIVGAGLFGFMGMILGVPVFVLIYNAISALISRKLKRSGLPLDNEFYIENSYVDPVSGEGVKVERQRSPIAKKQKNRRSTGDAPAVKKDENSDSSAD